MFLALMLIEEERASQPFDDMLRKAVSCLCVPNTISPIAGHHTSSSGIVSSTRDLMAKILSNPEATFLFSEYSRHVAFAILKD